MMNKTMQTGRLTKNVKIVKHNGRDSATAYLTIAVKDNFATKGEYLTQFIPMQSYLKPNQIAYFEKMSKGDLVEVEARLKSAVWSKDNEKVRELQIHIESIHVIAKAKRTPVVEEVDYELMGMLQMNEQELKAFQEELDLIPLEF